jgi:hypothetical protein
MGPPPLNLSILADSQMLNANQAPLGGTNSFARNLSLRTWVALNRRWTSQRRYVRDAPIYSCANQWVERSWGMRGLHPGQTERRSPSQEVIQIGYLVPIHRVGNSFPSRRSSKSTYHPDKSLTHSSTHTSTPSIGSLLLSMSPNSACGMST